MKPLTKFLIVMLFFILIFSFNGFLYAEYDIKNTTVIQGIGIDYDTEKEEYVLTAEIFDISMSAGTGESESGNLTKVLKVRGDSVASAMEKLTLEVGKSLVYSQKRVVIIGKEALYQGISNTTDFFLRDYKTRSNVLIASTKDCKAEDIIKSKEGNASFPARELQTLLESGDINGYTQKVDFATVTNMVKDDFSATCLPVLNIRKDEKEEYAYIDGFAVLEKEKPTFFLSLEEVRSMLFVNDLVKGGTMNVDNKKIGLATLRIVDSNSSVKVRVEDEPEFFVKVHCVADIIEVQSHNDISVNEKDSKKIAENAENKIYKGIRHTLEKCLDENNCDVFKFGRRVWIFYPSYCKGRVDEVKKSIGADNVTVEVEVEIRRTGQGNA